MKIAILAAGKSDYFPALIDKPKCLYHLNKKIQLERVIEKCSEIVGEENLIVVAGYKYKKIKNFLKKYPKVCLKVNERYLEPAIFSYRKAAENENEDIVFICADESIKTHNIKKICNSPKKMALLCHDNYYYYSLGIFKLRKDQLKLLFDNQYLSMEYIKKIYCFANNKDLYDGTFKINSGICLGYMVIDFVRRIAKLEKIENPATCGENDNVDFIHYDPSVDYVNDLDYIADTDEYKSSVFLRFYSDYISNIIRTLAKKVMDILN